VDTAVEFEALHTSWPSSFDESPQVSSKPGALHKPSQAGLFENHVREETQC
jgi:hypothetical protein